jgi:fumarylacetoacetate (FAA) hydrolase family protein
VKASGVTFVASLLERVIEEQARGDASRAVATRKAIGDVWSQYLEVAIGPDAEIFTKGPTLSSMGWGDHVGVRSDSHWNNPEPEVVLLCDGSGQIRGASLGNDVNLRDFEGRSALLLSKAKDNNASCAIGPFVRLFDDGFSLDDVRSAEVELKITGRDNFVLDGHSNMSLISRDPAVLAGQAFGKQHQYPDGFALFLGTMFAPIQDRDTAGQGFTHKVGDRVRVSTPKLGVLENEVTTCDQAPPWTFGVSALIRNLAGRGLL